jgi:molybdate transport system ATP-binding protein
MQEMIADIRDLTVRIGGSIVLDQISFTLRKGMCLAIFGEMASGKTTLLKALNGQVFHSGTIDVSGTPPKIGFIPRQHLFTNRSNLSSFYYQQRFNSFDADETRTVEEELLNIESSEFRIKEVLAQVGLEHARQSGLILLSNGEHKRYQIAKALLNKSTFLLLDTPFTGLDVSARDMLSNLLAQLREQGIAIILTTGSMDFTSAVTHIAHLNQGKLSPVIEPSHSLFRTWDTKQLQLSVPLDIPAAYPEQSFSYAIQMQNTTIKYGDKTILDSINWEVRKGECWQIRGHNGSGKSTLLSLIYGDNPQAFSQNIWLFDRKKGTGESIWDIKRPIGFISPELHHYIGTGSTVFDLIASGLFDTMGLFRTLNKTQTAIVQQWMDALQLGKLANRFFDSLSDGEQRTVLLARALVKNPPLLLLDEPCQGLDEPAKQAFIQLIDTICQTCAKTLIYVSHYETEIPSCVTRRLTLQNGKIIEYI